LVFGQSFFRKNIDFSQKKIDNNTVQILSNYYMNQLLHEYTRKIALQEFSYGIDF